MKTLFNYSAAPIYPNYAYAYYTLFFSVYAYVYTHISPFVMHSHKFLYMKHCWSNKGHMGMKGLPRENCILLKRHADQWKLSHFKFSITQIHWPFLWLLLDLKLPNMGRKLKQSLEIPILTRELCFSKEISVLRHGSQVVYEIFFVWTQHS